MPSEDYSPPPQYPQPASSGHPDTRYAHSNTHHQNAANPSMPELEQVRSRGQLGVPQDGYTSDSNRYHQARQPINEAVTSAFNTTDATTAAIPPELLNQLTSQITANVIQQLKASNVPPMNNTNQNIAPDTNSSTAGSPPIGRATVYTPPSPYRPSEGAAKTQTSPNNDLRSSQQSYGRGTPPLEKRPGSPLSSSSYADDSDAREDRPARPKGPRRISTGGGATILEKVWGTLFNEQGEATVRLGQFLRGIAVHMIEDYEPKHSLVITPEKLQHYYQETKLDSETYPWQTVFDDRTSSISRMYREIEAQHHLVQEKLHERPDIPGLTPQGFETWATLLLRAHPDLEFERLAKTALDMPISNPDEKRERFPKELSRRLFPKDPDNEIAAKLQKALASHCNVSFTSRLNSTATVPQASHKVDNPGSSSVSNMTSQQPAERQQATITPVSSHDSPPSLYTASDRTPQPYSTAPSEAAIEEDGEDVPTPQPIERERKPYVAHPGGGKSYDNFEKPAAPDFKAPAPEVKAGRSSSTASNSRPGEYSKGRPTPIAIHQNPPQSAPVDIPESRRQRANSIYYKDQSSPRVGRNRSPSISKDNGYARRSDTDATYGSHHSAVSNEPADEARRYRDYESQRERLAGDRYDSARMAAYDPRDRERDNRPRIQSVAGMDIGRSPYSSEEDYYRNSAGYPPPRDGYQSYPMGAQYPPNAYREREVR